MGNDRSAPRMPVPEQRTGFNPPPAATPPVAMAPDAASPGAPPQAAASQGAPAAPGGSAPRVPLAGRPRYFPSVLAWLRVGMGRSWRGVLGALIGTWFYVPFALVMGVVSAVVLGAVGFFGGFLFGQGQVPAVVANLPLLGSAIEAFLPASGGVLGGLIGVLLGLVLGFVGALLLFWVLTFADDPLTGVGWLLGLAAAGLLVGALYTLYRVVFEPLILRLSGARRLSRRERDLIMPVIQDCAWRLQLANHPPVLMDDGREPSAVAYTRHIVISQGLLEDFQYDQTVIAGVISHELVHWRNGDPISAAFVRGVALPLYLVHGMAGWISERVNHPLATLLIWLVFWPVLVTVRFFIMPLQAADARQAEYRADQGAVLAGHGEGLRRVLGRLRRSFETGRNGWTQAVCAAHPPNELRLEKLEDPSRRYPLPDPDGPAAPLPAPAGGSLRQD